jgi:hypothetical protein
VGQYRNGRSDGDKNKRDGYDFAHRLASGDVVCDKRAALRVKAAVPSNTAFTSP